MTQFQGNTADIEKLVAQQHNRLLRMHFPRNDGPKNAQLLANSIDATERLSCDYAFNVEVLSDSATIELDDVLGKMITVELVREDGTLRYFNGYVFEFSLTKTDGGFAFYEMFLRPWLSFLRLRQNNVAFHNLRIIELTEKVFSQYLKLDWRHRITGNDVPVTYICQHNESDHNFLHRYWEARGWSYGYEHRVDGHTLCLTDNTTRTTLPVDGERSDIPFQDEGGASEDDGIHHWSVARKIGSESVTLASFNFKHPRPKRAERISSHSTSSMPRLEVYENTGTYGFTDYDDGEAMAQLRQEEVDARRLEFKAEGNDRTAQPNRWFTLSGHYGVPRHGEPRSDERMYLIVSVQHKATNNYQNGQSVASGYKNALRCIPHDIPWRPGRGFQSEVPRIYGVQTAVVVGPANEEIHTDGFGRVKVQFHWDRLGEFNDQSSPWVRVVTGWAGSRFGQISLPRIGTEVVVQFLDGNIDHPLIVGMVYNASNMPPWELPMNKTQSGILTRSSRGGKAANANAFRFEDKLGAEEVWLHAEKDQRIEVEHDESHWVGQDRRKTVDRDETVEIKHDRTETVGHDERITVRNDRSELVEQNEIIEIGNNRTENVGKNEKVTIRGRRSERVLLSKDESIGLFKALSIGGAYQISVAAAMNTSVGMSQSTQVAGSKRTSVADTFAVKAGSEFSINVGGASFKMSSDGTISLSGSQIFIESSGPVVVNGKNVDINSGKTNQQGQASLAVDAFLTSNLHEDAEADAVLEKPRSAAKSLTSETKSAIAHTLRPGALRPPPTRYDDLKGIETVRDAPKKIVFAESVQTEFKGLWRQSFPKGNAMEYGGVLVADSEGAISIVNKGTSSKAGAYKPDFNIPKETRMVGIFHTHPYSEEGETHVDLSLSGADIGVAINNRGLIVAQSGEGQFAIIPTKKSPSYIDVQKLHQVGGERIAELMDGSGLSFPAASRQTAKEAARAFNMAYYEGRNGVLKKIED